MLISSILQHHRYTKLTTFIIISALALNLLVSSYALSRESTYQYDTVNLIHWIKLNHPDVFAPGNYIISCNAPEPSMQIPKLLKKKYNLDIKEFIRSSAPKFDQMKQQNLFLFSPRFGNLDNNLFKEWHPMFYSKNWILFLRKKE